NIFVARTPMPSICHARVVISDSIAWTGIVQARKATVAAKIYLVIPERVAWPPFHPSDEGRPFVNKCAALAQVHKLKAIAQIFSIVSRTREQPGPRLNVCEIRPWGWSIRYDDSSRRACRYKHIIEHRTEYGAMCPQAVCSHLRPELVQDKIRLDQHSIARSNI